nr:hypothetical protein Itr_chr07CG11910 [Ipomoea trifida]
MGGYIGGEVAWRHGALLHSSKHERKIRRLKLLALSFFRFSVCLQSCFLSDGELERRMEVPSHFYQLEMGKRERRKRQDLIRLSGI